ncbi:MAG: antibiotic biosynthesis monooxygenase [Myroides sp.]|jgi:quinol monooxygenase YgiN|nr:antibiotic biosynthesis monooxygenase [Myroides sp.]
MEKFIVAQFFIKAEHISEFRTLTNDLIKDTRLEPGNISYHLYQDVEDNTHFVFNEQFKDQSSFDAHTQTAHFNTFIAAAEHTYAKAPLIDIIR